MEKLENIKIYRRKVHYYETDQMAIVHHSNYIRWFEEARIDFLEQIGLPMSEIERQKVQIPVLSVTSHYKTMTRFEDEVLVGMKIEKYNGIKLCISYEIKDAKTQEIRNIGSSEHCFLDENGKVISLKKTHPDMHSLLELYINCGTYQDVGY